MSGLSKWAKYGVLAMIVADGVGIMVVHNRLNQPVANVPSLADDMPIALAETPLALPKDAITKGAPATDSLQVSDTVAQMDVQASPAVSRMDPLPAPMAIEPLALDKPQASPRVARQMQEALRAPVIPAVRIAELHSNRKSTRTFSSEFANDIAIATQSTRQAPSDAYAEPSAVAGAVDEATPDYSNADATSFAGERTTAQDLPTPAFGGPGEPQQLQLDLPTPTAPEASAAPTGEIPAS